MPLWSMSAAFEPGSYDKRSTTFNVEHERSKARDSHVHSRRSDSLTSALRTSNGEEHRNLRHLNVAPASPSWIGATAVLRRMIQPIDIVEDPDNLAAADDDTSATCRCRPKEEGLEHFRCLNDINGADRSHRRDDVHEWPP